MPFYTENEAENKTVDMQMVNDKGSLEKYNTLRVDEWKEIVEKELENVTEGK